MKKGLFVEFDFSEVHLLIGNRTRDDSPVDVFCFSIFSMRESVLRKHGLLFTTKEIERHAIPPTKEKDGH